MWMRSMIHHPLHHCQAKPNCSNVAEFASTFHPEEVLTRHTHMVSTMSLEILGITLSPEASWYYVQKDV
jgi:hypothetical protein